MNTLKDALAAIQPLADEYVALVKSQLPTTKDYYNKWGEYIAQIRQRNGDTMAKLVIIALIHAGAPRDGVINGAKLIAGLDLGISTNAIDQIV